MTILVTGATGNVGRHVVRRLLADGHEVRALSRNPQPGAFPAEVGVFRGDLDEPRSLSAALEGVQALFLFPVAETAREVVALAEEAGVRRVVVLSSGAVTDGSDTDFHLPVERAVEASGLEWTHVRPGEFASNRLALWGPPIREGDVVSDPMPDDAWFPVHERDIADVAVLALTEEGHNGQAYTVNGPELLSRREQVGLIAKALGREIRCVEVSRAQAREIYLEQGGFAAENADFLLGYEDYSGEAADAEWDAEFDPASLTDVPTAQAVTGRPARTFAQWARDHVEDFQPLPRARESGGGHR
ncbi:SDR family oxidoreductase [Streptomyces albipurpureus]|uniref:NAD(P)H-binding protein n=1 Tax=Streptomyces albipurpureus TaxID=2897419 RepID=A0ABT0UV20_9ACTN|nr:NAD(P)H-binding protein [Streptomyces sp. CWNU-1]MCM2392427.1 NAD(P)H-binding protein [Streptomyces sp. CWNU-1]